MRLYLYSSPQHCTIFRANHSKLEYQILVMFVSFTQCAWLNLISSTFWPLKNGNSAPIPVGSTGNLRPFQGFFTWCHRCRPTSDPWHVSSRLPLEAAAASQEESVEYPWRPMEIFDYLFKVIGKSKTYSPKMVVKNGDEIYARKKIEVTLNKPKESLRLTPYDLIYWQNGYWVGWAP